MEALLKLVDVKIEGKRVLIREDLNVPLNAGKIVSDARIRAALPTIKYALHNHAAVIIASHLGRPTEDEFDAEFSLEPVAARLSELLEKPVRLARDWQQGVEVKPDEVVLLENVRFNRGEKNNDDTLAKQYAALCDVFVMDAFATAHRAQASTEGVARFAPKSCAGPLLVSELNVLGNALEKPARPMAAIVGGSKVSSKLLVLESLAKKVDQLIVGGGIANTFIAASGFNVGLSLYESDYVPIAKQLLEQVEIPIPLDVVVANNFTDSAKATIKEVDQVLEDEMILDIGPQTAKRYAGILEDASTILWNGPVGVFEWPQFAEGTKALAHCIAESSAFSIVGGGDTIAAVDQFEVKDKISYVCTGGGAFLQYLEGKALPGVVALQNKTAKVVS